MQEQNFNFISDENKNKETKQEATQKNAKKVGRKAKSESEKAKCRVLLYFTQDEFNALEQIGAEQFMGLSAQALAKQVLLNFMKCNKIKKHFE